MFDNKTGKFNQSGKNTYHDYNYKMPGNVIKLLIFKSMLVPVTYTTTSEYFTRF